MAYKKKAQPKDARASKVWMPAKYRTECAGCDKYAHCTNTFDTWLCVECEKEYAAAVRLLLNR